LKCGVIHNRETEIRTKDGSIVFGLLSVVPLETSGNQLALGIFNVLSTNPQLPFPIARSNSEDPSATCSRSRESQSDSLRDH
jgi:hypothetical protein